MGDRKRSSGSTEDGFTSTYSTYKRLVTSTEVNYGSHTAKSSYEKEAATDYQSARGVSSSTKELVAGSETRSLPVYIAIQDFVPDKNDKDSISLDLGQIVEVLDSKNSANWLVRTKARPPVTGWVPGSYFETPSEFYKQRRRTRELTGADLKMTKQEEALNKRDQVFQELLRTEEEFVADLRHVIESYVKVFEDPATPDKIRHLKDQLTMNLRELYNFHANVLLKGLQFYSDEPERVGQTFVRLERDFDHHVKYCRDEPDAEKLLEAEPTVKEFFQKLSSAIETGDKTLLDYLRLPIHRLQQYQQYIKEQIKYTSRAELSTKSLQKSLEMMLGLPQRAVDLTYIKNIQGYPGDTVKLGRLLRHEQFRVWEGEKEGEGTIRYVFLFKSRLLFSEKEEPEDPDDFPEFKHVATVRLDKYDVTESETEEDVFVLSPTEPGLPTYFIKSVIESGDVPAVAKQAWVKEIAESKEGLVVEDDIDMTETMTEFVDISDVRSEFSEYSTGSRKSSLLGGTDDGPPKKKPKSPPAISPSASSHSLYSGSSGDMTGTTTLDMQGTRVTRTQYGFRTLQESSAKMCLKVTGYPLPLITWFKDGDQLEEDDRHTFYADDEGFFAMTIDPVNVEDTGRYTCVASNEYGQATTSAFFRVVKVEHEPMSPKFEINLKDLEIKEGESAQFECEVGGWPEPELQWLIDGQPVYPSNDFKIDYDGQKAVLEIRDAQPDDAGVYSVRITNELGSKESLAHLVVQEDPDKSKVAPEFQAKIEDVVCDEGDNVRFKAVITGDPLPDVSWLVNGALLTQSEKVNFLAEDGIYIVTINDVTTHFDGEVTCRAINRLGDTSCTARLTVNVKPQPPRFEEGLVDQMLTEGDSAKFQVTIDSDTEAEISWLLNGKEIKQGDEGITISSKGNGIHILEMSKVRAQHMGKLICKVTNEQGTVESQGKVGVRRRTRSQKPEFQSELGAINLAEGDTLKTKVLISGDPPPSVKWYINNKIVVATEDTELIAEDGVYICTIRGVSADMTGTIKCVAYNKMGETNITAPITVIAPIPVEFEQFLADATCREGDTLKLKAVLLGEPSPDVTWYSNGKKLTESKTILIVSEKGNYTVTIKDITLDYCGEVMCKAINEYGEASSTAKLTVLPKGEPPDFTEWLSNVSVREGSEVKHKVVFTGNPTPTLTWYINNKEVSSSDENIEVVTKGNVCSLTLKEFSAEHVGEVICTAENDAGEVSCTAQMHLARTTTSEERSEEIALAMSVDGDLDDTDGGASDDELTLDDEISRTETPIQAPKFITKIKDVHVKRGHQAVFECVVPESKGVCVKWLKDGNEIEIIARIRVMNKPHSKGIKTQLVIDNVDTIDAGMFECVISNSIGEERCAAQLEVISIEEIAPEFTEKLTSIIAMEGETATLQCAVIGSPLPKVEWYKDGKKLNAGKKISIEVIKDKHQLIIESVTKTDVGSYEAVASNEFGKAKSEAKVELQRQDTTVANEAPVFVTQLQQSSVIVGETAVLECRVTAVPPPEVQWMLNDKKLAESKNVKIESKPDGTQILTVKGAKDSQSGVYKCVGKNVVGSAETAAQITIEEESAVPEFVTELTNASVAVSETAQLECKVTGKPAPEVRWFVNEKQVKESKSVQIKSSVDGTQILNIKDATLKEAGMYKCVASNKSGTVETAAQITVEEMKVAPVFVTELTATSIAEGQTAQLECKVTAKPAPEVHWLLDGKKIKESSHYHMQSKSDGTQVLTVKSATDTQIGVYKCVAENAAGSAETTAELQVEVVSMEVEETDATSEYAPEFLQELQSQTAESGSEIQLNCVVSTKDAANLEVQWLKDGKKIQPDARHSLEAIPDRSDAQKLTMVISKSETVDAGKYQCVVKNKAGEAITQAKLDIKKAHISDIEPMEISEGPIFTKELCEVSVDEGQTVKLECAISGTPLPEVRWLKDGQEIVKDSAHMITEQTDDGGYVLKIQNVKSKDVGLYSIEAVNPSGSAKSEATLKVSDAEQMELVESSEVAPDFVSELKAETVSEGETAKLTCAISPADAQVVWLKNGEEITPDNTHVMEATDDGTRQLMIKDATVADKGTYSCQIATPVGVAKSEACLNVKKAIKNEEMIEVLEAPEFTKSLDTCQVEEGQEAVLECAITGEPKPEVHWMKDGTEVVADGEHIEVQTEEKGIEHIERLLIHEATSEDVGTYEAQAVSKAGRKTSSAKVEVQQAVELMDTDSSEKAPEFVKVLHGCEATELKEAYLECQVTGTPAPTIQWLHDGEEVIPDGVRIKSEILTDGTQKLVFSEAKLADQGEYRCEASNTAGSAWTDSVMSVKTADTKDLDETDSLAPDFLEPLHAHQATVGETVEWECKIVGQPTPEIKWFKGDKELTVGTDEIQMEASDDGTLKLIITEAKLENVGDYRCELSNIHGVTWSDATLNIQEAQELQIAHMEETAPDFLRKLESQTVTEGEELIMDCVVTGSPAPKVLWYHDGKQIEPLKDENVKIESLGDGRQILTVKSVKLEDIGKYSVEAINSAGTAKSITDLKVQVAQEMELPQATELAPEFLTSLHETKASQGESVSLECSVKGEPTPHILWMKDGKEVKADGKHVLLEVSQVENGVVHEKLVINKTTSKDQGVYKAVAKNTVGEAVSDAKLDIKVADQAEIEKPMEVAPKFLTPLHKLEASEGETVQLECAVQGEPQPKVIWMKGEQEIKPDGKHVTLEASPVIDGIVHEKLTIKKATSEDQGVYKAVAINTAGDAASEAELEIKDMAIVYPITRNEKEIIGKIDNEQYWPIKSIDYILI